MKRDTWKCRYCGRRSERISLGLSCFHCGRKPDVIQIETIWATVIAVGLVAVGAGVARFLA